MRQSRVRRMNPNPKTIGFADNIRRSKPLFKKIKQIYGEELERLGSEKNKQNISLKKLTEKEKSEIRKHIREQIIKEQRKEFIIWIIGILIVLGIIVVAGFFM